MFLKFSEFRIFLASFMYMLPPSPHSSVQSHCLDNGMSVEDVLQTVMFMVWISAVLAKYGYVCSSIE